MSDHLHASSLQGSHREQEDAHGWREENRISREDKDGKYNEVNFFFWQNGSQPK